MAFSILGTAYGALLNTELSLCQNYGLPYDPSPRYYQSMLSYRQSLVAQPDSLLVHELLRGLHLNNNRPDLALAACRRIEELVFADPELSQSDPAKNNRNLMEQLSEQVNSVLESLNQQLDEKKIGYVQAVNELMSRGLHQNALLMLEEHAGPIDPQNQAYPVYGMLLLENGRLEEAYRILVELEDVFVQNGLSQELHYVATANLTHGGFRPAPLRC